MTHEFEIFRRSAFESTIVRKILTACGLTRYRAELHAMQADNDKQLRLETFFSRFPAFPMGLVTGAYSRIDKLLTLGSAFDRKKFESLKLFRDWLNFRDDFGNGSFGLVFPWPRRPDQPVILHDAEPREDASQLLIQLAEYRLIIEPFSQRLQVVAEEWDFTEE